MNHFTTSKFLQEICLDILLVVLSTRLYHKSPTVNLLLQKLNRLLLFVMMYLTGCALSK
jgi:hypothetical protein